MYEFIDHDKEWNFHSITDVLTYIKAEPIPSFPLEDRIFCGFSQDGRLILKLARWAIRKPSNHPRFKMLNWIWKLRLLPKIKFFPLVGY